MTKAVAYLLVSSALVLWGLSGVFTQNLLDKGLGVLDIAFWRLALSGVLFIVHALWQKNFKLKSSRELLFLPILIQSQV